MFLTGRRQKGRDRVFGEIPKRKTGTNRDRSFDSEILIPIPEINESRKSNFLVFITSLIVTGGFNMSVAVWTGFLKKMDTVAMRRGDEWLKPLVDFVIANNFQYGDELVDINPMVLTGAEGVPEVLMAVLKRVCGKVTREYENAEKAQDETSAADAGKIFVFLDILL